MTSRYKGCPRCGTVHMPTAVRCGCGYTFNGDRSADSSVRRARTAKDRWSASSSRLLAEARAALSAAAGQSADTPAGAPETPAEPVTAARTLASPEHHAPRPSGTERPVVAAWPTQRQRKKEAHIKSKHPDPDKTRASRPDALPPQAHAVPVVERPVQPDSNPPHEKFPAPQKTESPTQTEPPAGAPKECPHCTAVVAAGAAQCRCGFRFAESQELLALALAPGEIDSMFKDD